MSQIATSTWSEVAASNNAAPPGGWPEGQAPSTVNDCAREMMSALKIDWNQTHPTVTSGGSANVQTLTYGTAPAAYVQGLEFSFIAGFTNTGTATLNANALGAKSIFMDGVALVGGEIVAGSVVDVKYDGTQFQITSARSPGTFPGGFKNWLLNGDFQIQQRSAGGALSTSHAASTSLYCFDRWFLATGANQASTVFVATPTGIAAQSRYAAVFQRTAGQTGTGVMLAESPMTTDMIVPMRGAFVTLSFKIAVGATFLTNNSGGVLCKFYMGTGTEGKRSSTPYTGETSFSVSVTAPTSSYVQYSVVSSVVVPATTTQAAVQFSWTPTATAGATDQVVITDVQIEIGGKATAFDRRPFVDELARCQRFFWKSFDYATAPAQNAGVANALLYLARTAGATSESGAWLYPVPMRISPSVTLYNPSAANAQVRDVTNAADCSASAVNTFTGSRVLGVSATGNAATTVGAVLGVHAIADADL